LIILRSTVTVGTARTIVKTHFEKSTRLNAGFDFYLASAPERTVEGKALQELFELPQIIGSENEESIDRAANIFNKITKTVIRVSSYEAAEIVKLFDNTSRDVNIALGNQFGLICEKLGLQSKEIVDAANYGYPRNRILISGAGVGGQCLVKDPYFLIESVKDKMDLRWIEEARKINDSMPFHVIELIQTVFKKMGKNIQNSKILILGISFKGIPETDDTRYSPAIPVIDYLRKQSAVVYGYDPIVPDQIISALGVTPIDPYVLDGIDCIVIMNNNKRFKELDLEKIKSKTKLPMAIIDGWQMIDPTYAKDLGINYKGVGMSEID